MAEKIGFISFSAFDYLKANEHVSLKRKAYDTAHPTRSFFESHPAIPPWNNLAHIGNEPALRKTPAEYQPLMNEYHRYFFENAVRHENYLRWVRRHRAWDRETEVHFGRFTLLRDYLNDQYARADYMRRGRMHQIFDKANERAWLQSETLLAHSLNDEMKHKITNAKALQKKLAAQALYQQSAFNIPDERQAWKHRDEITRASPTTHEDRIALNVHIEPSWPQALAIAHYQQQIQKVPIAPVALNTNTAAGLQTPLAAPIVRRVNGLG
ncbi:MAG: hypothetical protein EOP10_22015 [Proteobacteria bacterium]|nr:MAG: hypothetical protein EOP10_22015 [Pseudomonadota bacterium]